MYKVPYGKTELEFEVPPTMKVDVAESKPYPALPDLDVAILDTLNNPVGSGPITKFAKPTDKVCIAITDITRACPDAKLVTPMLKQLEEAGVPDENVTIIVGVGMHRASTADEKIVKLGEATVKRTP